MISTVMFHLFCFTLYLVIEASSSAAIVVSVKWRKNQQLLFDSFKTIFKYTVCIHTAQQDFLILSSVCFASYCTQLVTEASTQQRSCCCCFSKVALSTSSVRLESPMHSHMTNQSSRWLEAALLHTYLPSFLTILHLYQDLLCTLHIAFHIL